MSSKLTKLTHTQLKLNTHTHTFTHTYAIITVMIENNIIIITIIMIIFNLLLLKIVMSPNYNLSVFYFVCCIFVNVLLLFSLKKIKEKEMNKKVIKIIFICVTHQVTQMKAKISVREEKELVR